MSYRRIQYVVVSRSGMQWVAMGYSGLQWNAESRSVLQCVAVCCSVLQYDLRQFGAMQRNIYTQDLRGNRGVTLIRLA